MTSVEKRRSGRKSGGHRKHSDGGYSDTSSGGSFLDETDREVSNLTDRAFRSLCIGDEAVYNDSDLCSSSPCTQRDRQLAFSQSGQDGDREDREREELKRAAHESFSLRVQQYGQDWIHGGMYGAEIHRDPQWEVYGERTQGRVSATFQHSFVETSQQEESLREEQLSFLSNGATELNSQQRRSRSRVSSLIRAFNSEGQRDGAGMDGQLRDWNDETSWDKSALMSIQRELSEFSTSYQQNFNSGHFPSAGPFSSRDTNFYSSDVAAVAQMNSASSFMRSSHSKHSMSAQVNCNSNFFIHSEFSPFKLWRDHNRFPFQQGEVSGFMHCSEFPKWYETPMYKELSMEAQPQGPYRFEERSIRHPRNNLAPMVPPTPSRSTSTSTMLQRSLAVEKRCESELAGHFPHRKRTQSLGTNRLPSQRPSTASPTIEMSRRVQDTISSVKALQQKIKMMTEQNITTGMIANQEAVLYSNDNLIPFGNNTVAPNAVSSNTSTTPFNISQLLTPLVHANQEVETSEVPQYAVSPQPVEHPPVRAESRGATPDIRSSYKSRATSLLFNLKDNRKRVKSTYSPTKFKGLDTPEKNKQPSVQEPRDTVIDIPDFPDAGIQFPQVEESIRTNSASHQYGNQYHNPGLPLTTLNSQPATAHAGQYSEYTSSNYQTAQMQSEMVHHSGFTDFIPGNYASNQLANGQNLHEDLLSFTPYKQGMIDNVETLGGDVYRLKPPYTTTEAPRLNADNNQTREYLISKANTEQHFNETVGREFTKVDRYQQLKENKHDYSNVSSQDRWRQTNSQDTENFRLKTAISPWKQEINTSMEKDQLAQAYQRAAAIKEELNLPRDKYGEHEHEKTELRESFGVETSHKKTGLVSPIISNQLPQYAPFSNDTVENPAYYGQQQPGTLEDKYTLRKYYGLKENEMKDNYLTQNYNRQTAQEYRNQPTIVSNKDTPMLMQETAHRKTIPKGNEMQSLQPTQAKPKFEHNMQKNSLSNPDNASAPTMANPPEHRQFVEVKAEQAMTDHIKAQHAQAELAKSQNWAQVEQPKLESARLILAGQTGSEKVKPELTEQERVNQAKAEHIKDKKRKEEQTQQSIEKQPEWVREEEIKGEKTRVQKVTQEPKNITEEVRSEHMREEQGEQVKAQQAEAERLKEEHIKTELAKTEQAEEARIKQANTEQARKERIKAEQREEDRVRAAQVERERMEAEQIRTEKVKAEQAEAQRKAEQAKLQQIKEQQAKAEQAKLEQMKEQQAKAEQAKLQQIKEQQAKAEQAKLQQIKEQQAKAEQAKLQQIKEQQAKAEQAKLEQMKEQQAKAEQAKLEQMKEQQAKAEQAKLQQMKEQQAKAEQAKLQQMKEQQAKAEQAKLEQMKEQQAKAEQAKLEQIKEQQAKAEQAKLEQMKEQQAKAEQAKLQQIKEQQAKAEQAKLQQMKEQQAKAEQAKLQQMKEQQAKAEQAKLEQMKGQQAKAEQAKLEQMKEQQAKAEQAKLEQIKEQQAKAKQAKLQQIKEQQAKAEQAKLEQMKEQQAKAEQAKLQQMKEQQAKAEQAKLEQMKEQQAKAEQAKLEQMKEQQAKAEQAKLEQMKEQQAKAEQAKLQQMKEQQAKAEQAKLEQIKEQQAKAEQAKLEQMKEQQAKAEQAKLEQMKEQQAKAEQAKLEQMKEQQAKAEQAKLEQMKEQQAKAEQAKLQQIKEQQAKAEQEKTKIVEGDLIQAVQVIAEPPTTQMSKAEEEKVEDRKAEQAKLKQTKVELAKAELTKTDNMQERSAKPTAKLTLTQQVKSEPDKVEQVKTELAKTKAELAKIKEKMRGEQKVRNTILTKEDGIKKDVPLKVNTSKNEKKEYKNQDQATQMHQQSTDQAIRGTSEYNYLREKYGFTDTTSTNRNKLSAVGIDSTNDANETPGACLDKVEIVTDSNDKSKDKHSPTSRFATANMENKEEIGSIKSSEVAESHYVYSESSKEFKLSGADYLPTSTGRANSDTATDKVRDDCVEKSEKCDPLKQPGVSQQRDADLVKPPPLERKPKSTEHSAGPGKDSHFNPPRALSHKERAQTKQEILTSKIKAHAEKEISAIKEKGFAIRDGFTSKMSTKQLAGSQTFSIRQKPQSQEVHKKHESTMSSNNTPKHLMKPSGIQTEPVKSVSPPSTASIPVKSAATTSQLVDHSQKQVPKEPTKSSTNVPKLPREAKQTGSYTTSTDEGLVENHKNENQSGIKSPMQNKEQTPPKNKQGNPESNHGENSGKLKEGLQDNPSANYDHLNKQKADPSQVTAQVEAEISKPMTTEKAESKHEAVREDSAPSLNLVFAQNETPVVDDSLQITGIMVIVRERTPSVNDGQRNNDTQEQMNAKVKECSSSELDTCNPSSDLELSKANKSSKEVKGVKVKDKIVQDTPTVKKDQTKVGMNNHPKNMQETSTLDIRQNNGSETVTVKRTNLQQPSLSTNARPQRETQLQEPLAEKGVPSTVTVPAKNKVSAETQPVLYKQDTVARETKDDTNKTPKESSTKGIKKDDVKSNTEEKNAPKRQTAHINESFIAKMVNTGIDHTSSSNRADAENLIKHDPHPPVKEDTTTAINPSKSKNIDGQNAPLPEEKRHDSISPKQVNKTSPSNQFTENRNRHVSPKHPHKETLIGENNQSDDNVHIGIIAIRVVPAEAEKNNLKMAGKHPVTTVPSGAIADNEHKLVASHSREEKVNTEDGKPEKVNKSGKSVDESKIQPMVGDYFQVQGVAETNNDPQNSANVGDTSDAVLKGGELPVLQPNKAVISKELCNEGKNEVFTLDQSKMKTMESSSASVQDENMKRENRETKDNLASKQSDRPTERQTNKNVKTEAGQAIHNRKQHTENQSSFAARERQTSRNSHPTRENTVKEKPEVKPKPKERASTIPEISAIADYARLKVIVSEDQANNVQEFPPNKKEGFFPLIQTRHSRRPVFTADPQDLSVKEKSLPNKTEISSKVNKEPKPLVFPITEKEHQRTGMFKLGDKERQEKMCLDAKTSEDVLDTGAKHIQRTVTGTGVQVAGTDTQRVCPVDQHQPNDPPMQATTSSSTVNRSKNTSVSQHLKPLDSSNEKPEELSPKDERIPYLDKNSHPPSTLGQVYNIEERKQTAKIGEARTEKLRQEMLATQHEETTAKQSRASGTEVKTRAEDMKIKHIIEESRASLAEEERRAARREEERRAREREDIAVRIKERREKQREAERRAEEERKAKQAEEDRAAQKEEEMRAKQREEERRVKEMEEKRRIKIEEERRVKLRDEEERMKENEERRRAKQQEERAALEEQQRRAHEEQQRRAAQEEQQRRATKEEQQRRAALEEQQRRAHEEQQRRAAQEEQQRRATKEEQQRRAALEEQQRRAHEEQQRRAAKEEQQRRAAQISEEERIKQIQEQKKTEQQIQKQRSERQRREEWMRTQREEEEMRAVHKDKQAKEEKTRLLEESQAALKEEEKRVARERTLSQREDESRAKEEEKLAAYREKDKAAQIEEQKRSAQRLDALQYYAITSADLERKPRGRQLCSPLPSQRRNNPSGLESAEDSHIRSFRPHAPTSPAPSLPRSNTSSPALGAKPLMFKVKDNTTRGSSLTKSVKPRFHKNLVEDFRVGSPIGSERAEEEQELMRHSAVTPVHYDTGSNRLAAIKESSPFHLSSSQEYTAPLPHYRPYSRRSIVLDEDDSRSVISNMSEDVESYATSAADLADIRGLYDYERPESACSFSSDVSRSLGKPPAVPPKSEKALRRAKRLTTRRIKKELTKADGPAAVEKPLQEVSGIPSSSSSSITELQ
uniref:DUF4585 domain-containing protein n=1 Tax=Dicentrarchus labrax TaxID=13489 RepID=A0A8P4K2C1_DICLA